MTRSSSKMLIGALLGLLLASGQPLLAQDAQNGVEAQARGPIHEGYAAPVDGQPVPGRILDRQPPEPIEEVPAEQKPDGDNVQWIPGYWAWDDARSDFLWVSGFWRVPPPGRAWVPGSWRKSDAGFQWVAGVWTPTAQPDMQYLPQPPASIETGPTIPAPTADHVYVPGTWVYSGYRYAWRPGVWVMHRPGWVWIPSSYRWTPAGYVYVDGYWDYPLQGRGILFSPVYVDRRYCYRPGWSYSPTYVVYDQGLYGAMFVQTGSGSYYYGDYFEPRYAQFGYRSWISVSFSVGYRYDPLFSYYSVSYRNDPYWGPGLREVYVARYNGDLARPSVTVVNNTTVVNNVTIVNNPKYPNIGRSTNITNITNVNNNVVNINNYNTVVNKNTTNNNTTNVMKLQPIAAAQRQQFAAQTKELHATAAARVTTETHLATQGPMKIGQAPKVAKVTLPPSVVARAAATPLAAHQPPAAPVAPHAPAAANPPKIGGAAPTVGGTPPHVGPAPLPPLTTPPKVGGVPLPPVKPGVPMPPAHPSDKDKDKKKDKQ
jgi:hypothetical protein